MKHELLLNCVETGHYNTDFTVNGYCFTWGVSHVKFVIGDRKKYPTIEYFFYSIIKEGNLTSGIGDGTTWADRVDLREWFGGLTIKEIKDFQLTNFIIDCIAEIEQYLKYSEEDNTIKTSEIIVPEHIQQCWLVNETTSPRNHINTTDIYLGVTEHEFYYAESHWES